MATAPRPPTRIVVVTGPPASGKSTLGLALSEQLGIPLIAKDVEASALDEMRGQLAAGRWQPLLLPGELLMIDTRSFEAVDLEAIVSRARRHLDGGTVEKSAPTLP